MKNRLLIFCLILFFTQVSYSRTADSIRAFNDQVWTYVNEHPSTNLFLHTDKNIYSPNERLWFKAYTLSGTLIDSKVLYIRLADNKKKIVQSMQFPMNGILAHGDILLPDTLKDGLYTLYAYADRMMNFNPEDAFTQSIIIHKSRKKWRAEAYVTDTSKLVRGEKVEMLVRLKQNNDLVKNIKGRYLLFNGTDVVKKGGLKTNLVGECFIEFEYPDIPDDKTLKAVIFFEDEEDTEEIFLNIGHKGNKLRATVYPQNNQLTEGFTNKIAVTVTDVNGQPAITRLRLTAGTKTVASESTDSAGIAVLSFVPNADTKYMLRFKNFGQDDSLALTTPINKNGYTLDVAVDNDNCRIKINSHTKTTGAHLLLRSYDDILWQKTTDLTSDTGTAFIVPLDSFPKQVVSITLIDATDNLLAEQLILTRQQEDVTMQIRTNQQLYGIRKKITVFVKATDRFGNPVNTNFSVSVAEKNTIDSSVQQHITNAILYKHLDRPHVFSGSNIVHPGSINNLLLTNTWKHYGWADILTYTPVGSYKVFHNTAGVYGVVRPLERKAKKITQLPIVSRAGIAFINVSEDGNFDVSPETLLGNSNEKTKLMLGAEFMNNYRIDLKEYDADFDKLFCKSYMPDRQIAATKLSRYQMERLEKLTDPHHLQNVVVKKTKTLPFYDAVDYVGANCTDYVCINNIFNCPNHKWGTTPTVGARYRYLNRHIIYRGCGEIIDKTKPIMVLKAITIPNEFQVIDFDKEPDSEEDSRTTIYWNPNLYTDASGQTSFSFFTNNVTGDFNIVLQGITKTAYGLGAVGGAAKFTVK